MRMSVKKRLRNSGNKYGFAIKLLFVGRQHDTPLFYQKSIQSYRKTIKIYCNSIITMLYYTQQLNWKDEL